MNAQFHFHPILLAICLFLGTPASGFAKKGNSGIGVAGGYNLKSPGSIKNILVNCRIQILVAKVLIIAGDGAIHFTNKDTSLVQGKFNIGMILGKKRFQPYFLINSTYNIIGTDQSNGTILNNYEIGAGAALGTYISLGKKNSRIKLWLEGSFDFLITANPKQKYFGGLAGFFITL